MTEGFLQNSSFILYTLFFAVAVGFSMMINILFLRFFKTLGIRNNSDGTIIRWGALSKPSIGGITFYIIFLLSLASYSILFEPSQDAYQLGFIGILLSCGAGFIIGLADDAYNTRPWLKFGVQLLCAGLLISTGISIHIFESDILNYTVTLFWVIGIMNSINMLDNMDGITATVSIGIIVNTIYRILHNGDITSMHLLVLIGVLASLIAFLRFNWHPSKMYMGDTGSQFLGVFLAAMGIIYFWNDPYAPATPATGKLFAVTIMTFILPILDTTVVVVNRLSAGRSPFIGGKDHTTHSLALLGLSDGKVGIVFLALAFISLLLNVIIEEFLGEWTHTHSLIFFAYFSALLAFFFYTTRNGSLKTRARLREIKLNQENTPAGN
ncbi:MAG: undecaprenyl/decaprenyl-phosphate alpha-N-acetylglucosaminyl 1-phosphate transferase [Bacteroidetes bacterium]|jgi:UDP-GlcNAc:undecaprenyl-phosphate GlcNAc-1-phosphate transferase|nr:undecaprenyl/decaprenyl-phosphate alpha-N-acetylglucosaminyl 1-phosphate transferase [Bacteroidota bacterium]